MFSTALVAFFTSAVAVSGASIAARTTGSGTWYNIGGGFTACGGMYNDGQFVVAVGAALYDSTAVDGNPNHNTICGRQISIDGPSPNGPVTATIVDRCAACGPNDIDMTPALFQNVVGDLGIGRATINWNLL